jgi:high-affinity iron transporter
LVAGAADRIAEAVAGSGQELFNAAVLFCAVFMLGWHNVWMRRHGKELSSRMKAVGAEVRTGGRPLWGLAVVVSLAVLREGAELVLFLFGIASSETRTAGELAFGGVLGLALGAAAGVAIYSGLAILPPRRLFAVTSWLILFLAAGLASQGAAYLVQMDWLPPLGRSIWDTSAVLDEGSLAGQVLHTLVGYVSQPDGIQIIFYVGTLTVISSLSWWFDGPKHSQPRLKPIR